MQKQWSVIPVVVPENSWAKFPSVYLDLGVVRKSTSRNNCYTVIMLLVSKVPILFLFRTNKPCNVMTNFKLVSLLKSSGIEQSSRKLAKSDISEAKEQIETKKRNHTAQLRTKGFFGHSGKAGCILSMDRIIRLEFR